MDLKLEKQELLQILSKRKILISKDKLLKYLHFTKKNFLNFTHETDYSNAYGNEKYINPLIWQIGHVVFFYANLVLNNLPDCNTINYISNYFRYVEFYDSWKTPLENRIGKLLISYNKIIELYNIVIKNLENYINNNDVGNIESYLIMLGILHNEMHNEAFIFTRLNNENILPHLSIYSQQYFKNCICEENKLIKNIEYVFYNSGEFTQGNLDLEDKLVFDNEMPPFKKSIEGFNISKFQITEYQYLQFILDNGYNNEKFWSYNGSIWKNKNNIILPLYWHKDTCKNEYYKIINGKKISVKSNLPIMNISYYEANAFCKWSGTRLPTESEYEYVATNGGTTKYPWGNENIEDKKCNLNYNNFILPVDDYEEGNNNKGVSQLIGNTWEWCQESIYPYDGFKIDPVYREMSYPFFGYKKICKGGAFCVPDFLIHPRYRNAQYPDCRIQFIGFRVCKN